MASRGPEALWDEDAINAFGEAVEEACGGPFTKAKCAATADAWNKADRYKKI